MNRRVKLDAASVILGGEFRNHTNKQTNKQTVNDISTSCLSACVDKNHHISATVQAITTKFGRLTWGPHRALRTTSCMNFVTVTVASCR